MQNHQFMLKSLCIHGQYLKRFITEFFLRWLKLSLQKMKRWITNIYTYVKLQMTIHLILTNQRSGSESRFTVEELYTVRINDGL